MKKTLLMTLLVSCFTLTGCPMRKNGEMIEFTAFLISKNPVKETKSFSYKGHTFVYYNVYNDGLGNFVMADNTSFIANNDIQFGLKVKTPWVYKTDGELIEYTTQKDGYYLFSIQSKGFEITSIAKEISMVYSDINIGKIYHWC